MTPVERPDWVTARAACTLDSLFRRLCEEIEQDVAAIGMVPLEARDGYEARATRKPGGPLEVRRRKSGEPGPGVTVVSCRKSTDMIRIQFEVPGGQWVSRDACPAWSSQLRTCDLVMDNKHYAPWALSMKLLLPLFFPPTPGGD